ncbi:unnamed protein product, partial [Musa textilis]
MDRGSLVKLRGVMVNSVSHQLVVIIKKGEIVESRILMMKLIDYVLWSNYVLSDVGL